MTVSVLVYGYIKFLKTFKEKYRREVLKDDAYCSEKILEATLLFNGHLTPISQTTQLS